MKPALLDIDGYDNLTAPRILKDKLMPTSAKNIKFCQIMEDLTNDLKKLMDQPRTTKNLKALALRVRKAKADVAKIEAKAA